MKKLIILILLPTMGCAGLRANMKNHPALYGMAIGAIGGTTYALATRHVCANTYDGKPYQGTPPCPK